MIWRRTKPSASESDKPKGFNDFELRLGDVMRGERATLGKSLLDVQRELKIKATYVAAIENCDVSAFETPGFVAGYVRSYARYLGMDPDVSFRQFCIEANFEVAHGMSSAASTSSVTAWRNRGTPEPRDPLANPNASFVPRAESAFAQIEPAALGSLGVLILLLTGLGYGGWSLLQEVQRVQLAPVEQAPSVVAEIDPLGNIDGTAPLVRSAPAAALASSDALMDRLYRPEALDTPVMVSRDGPIAAIDPAEAGALAGPRGDAAAGQPESSITPVESVVQVVESQAPAVELIASREAWVSISSPDGTVLDEKTLKAGDRYVVPQMEDPLLLRTGNSGALYFLVNGQTHGPVAPGAQVVSGIALSPQALTENYALADIAADSDLARVVAMAEAPAEPPVDTAAENQ
jgi:cytoskeletal protein RodZ